MMKIRFACVGAALAAFALIAGCSGEQPETTTLPQAVSGAEVDATSAVRQLTDTMQKAGSARFEGTSTTTAQGGGTIPLTVSGVIDFGSGEGEAQLTGLPTGPMRTIFAGDVSYMQMAGNDRWVRMDLSQMAGATDPAQQLDLIARMQDVREVGTQDVRGVATRQFHGTVDMTDLVGATGMDNEMVPTRAAQFSLYLDSDGLLRRVEIELPGGGQVSGSSSVDYFDFGTPVSVQVPDPSQVDDFTVPGGN